MDPISDLIIRIKNAGAAGRKEVSVPYSELKFSIAKVLEKEGFVGKVAEKSKKTKRSIGIEILYKDDAPKMRGVKRMSKLSKRAYVGARDIKPVKHGAGRVILSTPKGILAGRDAKKKNVGGEALFTIW